MNSKITTEKNFVTMLVLFLLVSVEALMEKEILLPPECSNPICDGHFKDIYCQGRILALSWYFFGSNYEKKCLGTKLRQLAEKVLENFSKLPQLPDEQQFERFCQENFENSNYLRKAIMNDWVPKPRSFQKIRDKTYRDFALKLHKKWKSLGRKMIKEVQTQNESYPVLYVPNNFIVPGGSFVLYYYWDTYWILKGLLFSEMKETARGIIENFASLMKTHDFIPNGGGIGLSKRSQPPMFAQMLFDYFQETQDLNFLKATLPIVEKELSWWDRKRQVRVSGHQLYQYRTESNCPRPEAYLVDILDAKNARNKSSVWADINSACESGWDFSSRWFADGGNKSSIRTGSLVPVDLNSIMCRNFAVMSKLYGSLNDPAKSSEYSDKHSKLQSAVDSVLWNEAAGVWFDFDLQMATHRTKFYPSNLFPLQSQCLNDRDRKLPKIYKYVSESSAIKFPGGLPASLERSGQQWDFPNAWAPLVHFVIEGFKISNHSGLQSLGRSLAQSWLQANYLGFHNSSSMWEKYNVEYPGRRGDGGEYTVQEGFGWTNGVVLDLLRMYKDHLQLSTHQAEEADAPQNSNLTTLSVIGVLALVFGIIACLYTCVVLPSSSRSLRLFRACCWVKSTRGFRFVCWYRSCTGCDSDS